MCAPLTSAPAARDTSRPAGRLYEIDLLRIVAALAVVFFHYTFSGYRQGLTAVGFSRLSEVTRYGYLGVDLFFTISGFVVLLSAWNRRPYQFVISRVVRLYPAYLVAVTLTAVASVTLSRGLFPVSVRQYLVNLTMLNQPVGVPGIDVVYWTLWAELRFYVVVLALTWIGITRRRIEVLCWGWLAVTFLLELGVPPGAAGHALDILVQSQYSHYFIAGMALATMYRYGHSYPLSAAVVVASGNAVYRAVGFGHDVATRYGTPIHPAAVVGLVLAALAVLTLVALRVTQRWAYPWYALLGALTYPLYLVHARLGFIVFHRVGPAINRYLLLALTVAAVLGLAYLIHAAVERPVAPILKRFLTGLLEPRRGTHRTGRGRSAGQVPDLVGRRGAGPDL